MLATTPSTPSFMALTTRQRDDLHKAILNYLHTAGFEEAYSALRRVAPEMSDFIPDSSKASLVARWTGYMRMQKRILDLEKELKERPSEGTKRPAKEWLPAAGDSLTLIGHSDKISAISFHPIYPVLASASFDATVRVWDWDTGEHQRTLKGHTRSVRDCTYNSTGQVLATCSDDLFIKLWSVPNDYGNFSTLRGHEHSISSVRFLRGDTQVVSSSRDHSVRVWEIQTGYCIQILKPHENWIRSALPNPDGTLLLTCADDHTARITDLLSAGVKIEMVGHDNCIEVAAFVPAASIPSIRELIALPTTPNSSKVESPAISFVMTGSRDKTIKLWDALHGRCLWTFVGHDGWVRALAFHPCGEFLLSVADDRTMRIWELKTGRCLKTIEAHSPFAQCVAWGPSPVADGTAKEGGRIVNVVATAGADKLIKIWRP